MVSAHASLSGTCVRRHSPTPGTDMLKTEGSTSSSALLRKRTTGSSVVSGHLCTTVRWWCSRGGMRKMRGMGGTRGMRDNGGMGESR
eukprot:156835-Chlamydomonas_euryale.AAC.5